jgi:hypothetical protein
MKALLSLLLCLFFALPAAAQVTPVVTCATDNGDGSLTALFGFTNEAGASVTIPAGPNNTFSTGEKIGQPATFGRMGKAAAFAVVSYEGAVTWTLTHNGVTNAATATTASPACAPGQVQAVAPTLQCINANGDGTYNAHFGYTNPNAFSLHIQQQTAQNNFAPHPARGNLRTTFLKGEKIASTVVVWNGAPMTYTITGQTVAADPANGPTCAPLSLSLLCVGPNTASDVIARFVVTNPNPYKVTLRTTTPANHWAPRFVWTNKQNFAPGTYSVDVGFDGAAHPTLTWTLDGHEVTAAAEDVEPECAFYPVPSAAAKTDPQQEEEETVYLDLTAATAAEQAAPATFTLSAAYPNPFNPATQIAFTLPASGTVRLAVYDATGREVARLADGYVQAGEHTATFDAAGLPSGVYFYRLTTPNGALTRSMTLMK